MFCQFHCLQTYFESRPSAISESSSGVGLGQLEVHLAYLSRYLTFFSRRTRRPLSRTCLRRCSSSAACEHSSQHSFNMPSTGGTWHVAKAAVANGRVDSNRLRRYFSLKYEFCPWNTRQRWLQTLLFRSAEASLVKASSRGACNVRGDCVLLHDKLTRSMVESK